MALAEFYGQRPRWTPCPQLAAAQCATVAVPLDYADPAGERVGLAVARVPATDATQRIGSLLVNPGGPGGSGVEFAMAANEWASPSLRARYDIVGFDPRGVAGSDPITCMDDKQRDQYYVTGVEAETPAQQEQVRKAAEAYAQACNVKSGKLLPYIGTENVVADLDVLRGALGEDKLRYFGLSYGTLIGQYYAERFPSAVDKMVLDSVMDPKLSTTEIIEQNAASLDAGYTRFLEHCVKQECPLGATPQAAREQTQALLDRAEATPLAVPGQPERPVTDADIRTAAANAVADTRMWGFLTQAFAAAKTGDGLGMRQLADNARGRNPQTGVYDNSDLAHTAVVCLWTSAQQRDQATHDAAIAEATKLSPIFGPLDVFQPCATWPAPATITPHPIKATGTPPILVMNNAHDPLTPLSWAKAVADELGSALLTNDGDGHGSFLKGPCTGKALDDYLLAGTTPPPGTTCHDNPL